jgi:hypothetical protein
MAVVTDPPVGSTTPPYGAYAVIAGTFVGGLGVAAIAARALDRNPACQTPGHSRATR